MSSGRKLAKRGRGADVQRGAILRQKVDGGDTYRHRAAGGEEENPSSSNLMRMLVVILLIQVVVIGGIYVHKQFGPDNGKKDTPAPVARGSKAPASPQPRSESAPSPVASSGDAARERPVEKSTGGASLTDAAAKIATDSGSKPALNPGVRPPIPGNPVRPRIPAEGVKHVVTSGQTWEAIANEFGCDLEHLKKANPGVKQLRASITVLIPPPPGLYSEREIGEATRGKAPIPDTYTVQKGDSLARIAKKYGVKVDDLQKINDIKDPRKIQIGQVIKIPTK